MKTLEIRGSIRKEVGKKSSKRTRREGQVPCVIYSKEQNVHFSAPELSFKNLIYTHEANLVKLILDEKEFMAVLKDIQFHPVSDKILHIDFVEVFNDKPVIINIPITVSGNSVGVIAGGKLSVKKRNLKVKGLPGDLPEFLPVDITNLKIHDGVKVGDLSYDKIELLDMKKALVLSIATSRVAQKTEGETGEAGTPAGDTAAAE
ncbi:MAG: 50S ribosomal protein L25/general stress protein Ctc [Bacteroidales bacterium]|jgi:large subunit ribosomal protein L25|nr:50S ribosomal protein L25/general stress protein Ctc [Bacteroidales bacterium]